MDKTWGYKKHIEIGGTMESVQQELLKKLSNQSSIDEIQNYIKKMNIASILIRKKTLNVNLIILKWENLQ